MVILPKALVPPHASFIEVFASPRPQILRRNNSGVETYNDSNGVVHDFFTVIRECFDEFVACLDNKVCDDEKIKKAVEFFKNNTDELVLKRFEQNDYQHYFVGIDKTLAVDHLTEFCQRWLVIQIEDLEPEAILKKYDNAEAMFFVDFKMGRLPLESLLEVQGYTMVANFSAADLPFLAKNDFGCWTVTGGRIMISPRADAQIKIPAMKPVSKDQLYGKKTCSKSGYKRLSRGDSASITR